MWSPNSGSYALWLLSIPQTFCECLFCHVWYRMSQTQILPSKSTSWKKKSTQVSSTYVTEYTQKHQ